MPVIRMTDVYQDNENNFVVNFDDNVALFFKNREEMEDAFSRFINVDVSYVMRMLLLGDYLKNNDDTIGCNYDPSSPSAVWMRRTP